MQADASQHTDTKRPWAIRRWCRNLSIGIAALAEVALITTVAIAYFSGNRNPAVFVLPVGWPLFYAAVYGITYAIAAADQRGPLMEQYPKWYRALFPSFARRTLNAWFVIMPSVALLAFPLVIAFMSAVLVWAAATSQFNP